MSRILVVDDQHYVREFFSQELMGEGYEVVSIGDAGSVKQCMRDSRPDLVLLDLYLNGFEALNLVDDIKNEDPHIPVVIVTAYDSYINHPRLSQADGYMIKNFINLDKLKHKIAFLLRRESGRQG